MISVLIVNYFCHELTARAVDSVLADDPSAQVIVVDNSNDRTETDNLRKILPNRAELVVAPRNLGFGRACNLAFEQAVGEWVLLLNPDAFILPGCLQTLVSTLLHHPKAGAVSPVAQWDETGTFLLPPGQMQTPAWEWILAIGLRFPVFGYWLSMRFRAYALRCLYASRPIRQYMLSGGHMLLRRSAIDTVGRLFDPVFFMYYEDTDLCRRLVKAGFELMLVPKARAVHQWRHDPAKSEHVVWSRLRYMRKHFPSIWLMDRLRRKFEQQFPSKVGQFHDIGICTTAPIFNLPMHQNGAWLLELSPHPLLIPAIYHRGPVILNSIPASVWSLLGPARYWARITHPNGQRSHFTWEIPSSASKPNLEISPLKQVGKTKQTWDLDWAHPSNESELLALFQTAFGHEMAPELWRWKYYGLDTLGALVRRDGQAIAFYGGMPRAIYLFGSPATAVQIGDVMVQPEQRGILTRKGPFFLATTSFAERFVGHGKLFPLAFGFPSERAYRLGARLGLYEQVGEIMRVTWPSMQTRPNLKIRIRALEADQHAVVDQLWDEMAEALRDQVIGVRNWDYVQHRYLNHPTLSYRIFLVSSRWTGNPIGLFVVRILEDSVELVDLIAPPKRIPILVNSMRRLAGNLDKALAYAWITAQHAPLLAGSSGEITPLDIPLPNICWTPGIPASELQDRWWLMGGDTDFH
ncbi:MAG: GNAT family N-acetyltransferase [Methylococcaceae bacterium]